MLPSRKRLSILFIVLGLLALLFNLPRLLGSYRLNLTGSAPRGLYRITSEPIHHDSWVVFCPPERVTELALERGYISHGTCPGGVKPLLKRVAALPGDEVLITPDNFLTQGLSLPRAIHDRQGRPLYRLPPQALRVLPGEVWVYSSYSERSWDSRYWGPVAESRLHTAEPLFVLP